MFCFVCQEGGHDTSWHNKGFPGSPKPTTGTTERCNGMLYTDEVLNGPRCALPKGHEGFCEPTGTTEADRQQRAYAAHLKLVESTQHWQPITHANPQTTETTEQTNQMAHTNTTSTLAELPPNRQGMCEGTDHYFELGQSSCYCGAITTGTTEHESWCAITDKDSRGCTCKPGRWPPKPATGTTEEQK
jgi:hypothetical protein